LKLKEFLSVRAIEFDSVNILADPEGLPELQRLGARSIPVLSRGDAWTFAQNLAHVATFLSLNENMGPVLSPSELVGRMDIFLTAAIRNIRSMPDSEMETQAPGRPRSFRVLSHHISRIVETFLEVAEGAELTHALISTGPSEDMATFVSISDYGQTVLDRLHAYWGAKADKTGKETVQTYYGPQSLHELMERTTWHSGQHVRQWFMLLGMHGVTPDAPLGEDAFAKLPMPSSVWDG
jgi:hypothetical protein